MKNNKPNKSDVDVIVDVLEKYGMVSDLQNEYKDKLGILNTTLRGVNNAIATSILKKLKENRKEIVLGKGKVIKAENLIGSPGYVYIDLERNISVRTISEMKKLHGKTISIKAVIEGE